MDITLKLTQSFTNLRRLFVRTTVPANVNAFKADLQNRINMYNTKQLEEDPARQVMDLELKDEEKLTPAFNLFYTDGLIFANSP